MQYCYSEQNLLNNKAPIDSLRVLFKISFLLLTYENRVKCSWQTVFWQQTAFDEICCDAKPVFQFSLYKILEKVSEFSYNLSTVIFESNN